MDGALEGHNIAQTPPGRTSKCLILRDPYVFAGDLNDAYAHACVLSMPVRNTNQDGDVHMYANHDSFEAISWIIQN